MGLQIVVSFQESILHFSAFFFNRRATQRMAQRAAEEFLVMPDLQFVIDK
jgi:hypothetical protein